MDKISRTARHIDQVALSAWRFSVVHPAVPIDDVLQRIAAAREHNQDYGQIATVELAIHRVLQKVVQELMGRARLAQGKT